MGLETGDTINDLNENWPLGTDPKSQGDNHIRLIKSVIKNDALSLSAGGVIAGETSATFTPTEDTHVVNKAYVDGNFVQKSGDTMTGFLTLNSDPTDNLHAASKQYVDTASSGAVVKQIRTRSTTGTSSSSSTFVNAVGGSLTFAPTAVGNTWLIEITLLGEISNVASTNTSGYFTVAINGSPVGEEMEIASPSGSGGVGHITPVVIRYVYTTVDTVAHSITARMRTGGAGTVKSSGVVMSCIEYSND